MITREYFVKPNLHGIAVPWGDDKGPDYPGPGNFGTAKRPVVLSCGGLNEWFVSPKVDVHKVYFAPNPDGSPAIYHIGPDYLNGRYVQGSTCLYVQPGGKSSVELIGQGKDKTVLRFASRNYTQEQVSKWGGSVEDAVIRSSLSHCESISISGMTIDANFNGQGYAALEGAKHHGYKLHGVQVRAKRGRISDCRIVGCGSSSDTIGGNLANECFPLNIYSIDTEPAEDTPWIIEDCDIDGFEARNGGYATMCSVNPFTSKPEAMPVTFYDASGSNRATKFCCIVRNCRIRGISGVNGLGASGTVQGDGSYASNYVLFSNNIVENCTLGANFDTSGVRYVHFEDNVFIDCSAMAQLGTPTGGMKDGKPDPMNPTFHRNFYFARNTLVMKRHDTRLSPDHEDRVHGAGLIIRNDSAGIIFTDNIIVPRNKYQFCDWRADGDQFAYRMISISALEPYFNEYYGASGPRVACIDDWRETERHMGNVCIEPNPEVYTPFRKVMV